MDSFFWHDYETWGVNPALDWPSQFAGVRTDADLNVIDEPVNIQCWIPSDYVPSLAAAQITGLLPQDVHSNGLPEYQFFAQIYAQLAQAGTCGVGYNSIRFDDEVTRYGLYRNFYDPYGREWQAGCSRWDIVDMVRLCYAVRPDGIEWPTREDDGGNVVPSLRLEKICELNGIQHEQAHDALSDVYATIALAKKIKNLHPKLYDFALAMRSKHRVSEELGLGSGQSRLHISSRFGAINGNASLILPVVIDPINKNEVHCIDLRYSPEPLLSLSAEELNKLRFTAISDLPKGIERIPLKSVHINKSAIVATPKLVDDGVQSRCGIDLQQCEEHRLMLLKDKGLAAKLVEMSRLKTFPQQDQPEEAQLYRGFIGRDDRQLCQRITGLDGERLASESFVFRDARLGPMLFNYRARNFLETLNDEEQQQWSEHVAHQIQVFYKDRLESEIRACEVQLEHEVDKNRNVFIQKFRDHLQSLLN